jgi:hypothetical protein
VADVGIELLSEIAPGLKRAAIMFNPDFPASVFMPSFEAAATGQNRPHPYGLWVRLFHELTLGPRP